MSDDAPNALGLEFSQPVAEEDSSGAAPASPVSTTAETTRKEKKPYVNPDRFRTGGTQREKLSEEALAEKMARIREQNAKIKERRIHVQKDEAAFRKYEEEDRQRREEGKKFQEEINSTRESNAKLKMDQVGNREWDSIKQAEGDGFSDGGGRGGRDRWSKNESGGASEHAVPDWANEPTEGVNNWGDAPVGGDISQWHPTESSATEKAPDSNDESKDAGEPLLNWAGEPVPSVADWSVPSGGSNEPEKDWAGNIVGLNQDWTVPISEEPESRPNGGGRGGGRGRGRGRGDGERRGRGRGEGRGRARGGGGRGRGRSEGGGEVKIENNYEKQDVAGVTMLNWANESVPATVDWNVPTEEPVTEGNKADVEGPQLNWAGDPVPSMADWNVPSSNELEKNWAGDIVGLDQDWGTSLQSSEDQTDSTASGWKTDRGWGRGRGRSEGMRGRGDVRGRGRGDYDRGRGRDSERGRGRGEGRGRWRGEGGRGRGEGRGGRGRGEGGTS